MGILLGETKRINQKITISSSTFQINGSSKWFQRHLEEVLSGKIPLGNGARIELLCRQLSER